MCPSRLVQDVLEISEWYGFTLSELHHLAALIFLYLADETTLLEPSSNEHLVIYSLITNRQQELGISGSWERRPLKVWRQGEKVSYYK